MKVNEGHNLYHSDLSRSFLFLRYMYFSIISWAIQLTKVGLDRIIVYTLYNNYS